MRGTSEISQKCRRTSQTPPLHNSSWQNAVQARQSTTLSMEWLIDVRVKKELYVKNLSQSTKVILLGRKALLSVTSNWTFRSTVQRGLQLSSCLISCITYPTQPTTVPRPARRCSINEQPLCGGTFYGPTFCIFKLKPLLLIFCSYNDHQLVVK